MTQVSALAFLLSGRLLYAIRGFHTILLELALLQFVMWLGFVEMSEITHDLGHSLGRLRIDSEIAGSLLSGITRMLAGARRRVAWVGLALAGSYVYSLVLLFLGSSSGGRIFGSHEAALYVLVILIASVLLVSLFEEGVTFRRRAASNVQR